MRIGFIGLGLMGAHIASNLQKAGHELVVHDLRPEVGQRHLNAGATWAETPKDVAASTDIVFSSLPGPSEVERVALGKDGILEGIHPGGTYFDLSTNSPSMARTIHAAFAAAGAHMLDCPVSGGPRGAESGKLAIWVGGEEEVFLRHRPVLDAIGDQVLYVGGTGSALIAKLVHNCTSYAVNLVIGEVFSMGVKAGVDPLTLWKAVRQGGLGRARVFDRLGRNFLIGKYDPASFALRLAHKDVGLATMLGREVNVPMRMANLAFAEMTEALARGWGDRDSRSPMLLQQERAGISIAIDPKAIEDVLAVDAKSKG